MGFLADLYQQKYGASKEAQGGMKNLSPEDQAKFDANKGKPGAAPGGKKPATGKEKTSADKLAQFQGGKVASAAFFDELGKLNAQTEDEIKKAMIKEDALVQLLKGIK